MSKDPDREPDFDTVWWLELIRCPVTGESLEVADRDEIQALDQRRLQGTLRSRSGVQVSQAITSGFVNTSRQWFFPVFNGIPSFIGSESIPLSNAAS